MKTTTRLAAALVLSFAAVGSAAAQSDHGHGAGSPSGEAKEAVTGQADMMQDMMRMMMQMHAQMMGGNMTGDNMIGGGMMGRGMMMDNDMMQMMMGGNMMGERTADALRAAMESRLAEFDANGDKSLSLAEFEALHAAVTRETTVDRFQHLDADGDGKIIEAEMAAPARRMDMRRGMSGAPGTMMNRQTPGSMMGGQAPGMMMNGQPAPKN